MGYIVDATKNSPKVSFDTESLHFEISGRSMPENTRKFYDPIVGWIKRFSPDSGSKITLKIDLNYLNTSSTIALLEMLKELGKCVENGCSLEVFWHYEEYDEDMKMIGEDISSISELNFQYVEEPS